VWVLAVLQKVAGEEVVVVVDHCCLEIAGIVLQ